MAKLTLNIDNLSVDSFATDFSGDTPTPMAPTNPNLSLQMTQCLDTCAGTCGWSECYTCDTCQSCLPTCRIRTEPCYN